MVSYKQVLASNALINDATAPHVAVFVGGTAGVGQLTLKALVATGASMRVYLIGRKSSKDRMDKFIQELHAVNPKAEVIWVEGEISLLADVKRICDIIKTKEARVDLLFLTPGWAPFNGRKETAEGLEIVQVLTFYARILFMLLLLPLLNAAEAPRVVSVLHGGLERKNIDLDDIDLKKPGNFGVVKAHMQYGPMKTITMEKLADENPHVTFIHNQPGWVNTGNVRRGLDENSIKAWLIWLLLEPLIALFSFSDEESGQRNLFQSTSAAFGGRGTPWAGKPGVNSWLKQENGLYLVSSKCDCTPNAKVMPFLREKAQVKVWEHTQEVLRPYL